MTAEPLFVRRIERLLDLICSLCTLVASLALVLLIVTFGWLVFGRYVLNVTPTWVEQLALLLICYIAFLGAAAGVHEDSHIGVSLFRDMLPAPAQKLLLILIDLALAGFGAVMLVAGISLMQFGADTMLPMLNIPESVRTLAITSLGGLLILFAGTRGLLRIFRFRAWAPDHSIKET
ncbi:Tripartite ATP-independent periplasmic transporters, DctQ component [Pseudoruegeria aquimaris]|uniref:TRAP transporter small permease protein n=1 Tax=Pseudoruegeria aquimaris TaxID=393663 RepID=A0A1Y5T4D3_9RHOB|nr:TRAP transporter small permease subunit [Pseudoruegeria aquimaris]SLN52059.1 Tripartite ATP-independent periplasmic transporters, DctQ component [Pseudoruegeria aquimaris]